MSIFIRVAFWKSFFSFAFWKSSVWSAAHLVGVKTENDSSRALDEGDKIGRASPVPSAAPSAAPSIDGAGAGARWLTLGAWHHPVGIAAHGHRGIERLSFEEVVFSSWMNG